MKKPIVLPHRKKEPKTYIITLTVDIPVEVVADTADEAQHAATAMLQTNEAFDGAELKVISTNWKRDKRGKPCV